MLIIESNIFSKKNFTFAQLFLRSILVLSLTGLANICPGQTDSLHRGFNFVPEIRVSYNTSLIYPGASAGAEFTIKKVEINIQKRNVRQKSFSRGQFVTINLNWYHHNGFHDNVYMTSEWVMRKTRQSGYFSEFSAGPGYSRTFLGGAAYRVDNEGNISIWKHAGYSYALVTVGWGMGYDFSTMNKTPASVFAKMNMLLMFPYNSTIYFRPVLEFGVRFNTIIFSEILHKDHASVVIK